MNKNQTMLLTFAPGIFVLMWSTGYVAARFALGYIEPLTFLALRFAGVVIVARSQIVAPSAIGFLIAVLALAGITGGSLWEKRFGVSHHPVSANLVGSSAGLLGTIPFMLVSETMIIAWSWPLLGSLTYLIIGSFLIGVGLLLAMIRAGDVARVSALS